jgi:glycolate oxidase iron-sulfur subunit
VRPLLPQSLKNKVPAPQRPGAWPSRSHPRKMLLLAGCVQPVMQPNVNAATARVLDALGIEIVIPGSVGCCGAIRYHLSDHDGGLDDARRNIDAWIPHLDGGAEAIVMNASGCGAMVKDYGHLLRDDPVYSRKAERVSAATRDIAEILPALSTEIRARLGNDATPAQRVVFHPPCTLQHAQAIRGTVESLLTSLGAEVMPVGESHFCCGSAGTYSVLQPELSIRLRDRRLGHLEASRPELILSANIGCITHLQTGTATPVMHWIEWLDRQLAATVAQPA